MTTTGMDAFEMSEDQAHQEPPEGDDDKWGALRLIGLVALVAAFSGFVYLAYMQGVRNGAVGAPPVITAENGPYKVLPADPGGRSFDNGNNKIFKRLEGNEDVAENSHAAPAPETPAQLTPDKGDDLAVDGHSGALVVADEQTPVIPQQRPSGISGVIAHSEAKGGPINLATVQSPQKITDPLPARTIPLATAKPVPQAPAPEHVKPAPTMTLASAEPAPATTTTAASSAKGAYLIQIASYRDKPSAEDAWKKLSAKHGDLVSSLAPDYQTADVAAKGTYFRLRIGPFTTKDDASALCSALKARQQDCLVVKG